jgi:phosphotransferase system  glucose/maltose/N-acetylglucosamine-specific IIC component
MKLSRDGLIYRLATYFDGDEPTNFCELCRALMYRTFIILLLCFIAGAFLGDLVASIVVFIAEQTFFWTWSTCIVGGVFGLIIFFGFTFWIEHLSKSEKGNETLTFISTFYSSKKHKFCPSIELD